MNPVLTSTLQAIQAGTASLERVAVNVANAQMPGFRREVAAAGFDRTLSAASESADSHRFVHIDQRTGTLRPTGRDLDVALVGDGWFEVRMPDGVGHTRRGAFRVDGEGRLVTEQGLPVLGTGGEIHVSQSKVVIDAEGKVFDGASAPGAAAVPVGQLKVVRFEPGAPAQRLPNGLLRFRAEPLALDVPAQMRQGSLENANVSQAAEMLQLMQVVRHVETMQKVATAYDEMVGTAVRRLGDLS